MIETANILQQFDQKKNNHSIQTEYEASAGNCKKFPFPINSREIEPQFSLNIKLGSVF